MKKQCSMVMVLLCTAALVSATPETAAQTPTSQISPEWQALGWTLPKSYSPDQIALFLGLNAARGTWSFEAETSGEETTGSLAGKLLVQGGSKGGMASAWNLIWSWPADHPKHAIIENLLAMPEKEQFGLMLVRFGPVQYSEDQPMQKPNTPPSFFMGRWDGEKQKITWAPRPPFGGERGEETAKEETPSPVFEMLVDAAGKISIQNGKHLPEGQIQAGRATVRLEEAPQQSGEPQLLTGLHHIEKGSEISDPRILRYLPAEASDIHLISDRNGHMAHYRISPKAFDAFLEQVWKRYREERAAKPESWLDYSEEEIAEALKGASVGRYEPQVRSTEIIFEEVLTWEPLEKAWSYSGPRKRSAAGANYFYDREKGIAFHDAGYW